MNKKEPDKKKEESEVEGSLLPQEAVKEFKRLKQNDWGEYEGALDYWARKINPKVFEMEREKKMALLTIASDIDMAGE